MRIQAFFNLPQFTRVGHLVVGENLEWQGVRVMITRLGTMGPRKEAIALDTGELFGARKLSMWHTSFGCT